MNKTSKSLFVIAILTAFIFSVFSMCRCGMSIANASTHASCHGKTTHHTDSKPCTCCYLKASPVDTAQFSVALKPSFVKNFHIEQVNSVFNRIIEFSSSRTAYGGILLSQLQSVPVYLQTHNLRL